MNDSLLQTFMLIAATVLGIPILMTFHRVIELGLDLWLPVPDTCCCHGDAYSQLTNRVIDTLVRDRTANELLERLRDAAGRYVTLAPNAMKDDEMQLLRATIDDLVDFENRHQAITGTSNHPTA